MKVICSIGLRNMSLRYLEWVIQNHFLNPTQNMLYLESLYEQEYFNLWEPVNQILN